MEAEQTSPKKTFSLFVSCSQGIEPFLAEELEELGLKNIRTGYRGVYVDDCAHRDIYRINYCSRLAGRVLLPLTRFRCYDRQSLYRGASEINWIDYIPAGCSFAIDANVNHPELRNSLFAAQVVKDAICDQFREKTGQRPSVNPSQPDVQLNLFIQQFQATLSVDTSGVPLYKRGYRQESVEAPVQETLAAAMLRIGGYQKGDIFIDPCCGSGTFLIEAALIASSTPPGYLRSQWGFMRLPSFDMTEWLRIKLEADSKRTTLDQGHFFGVDISKNAARACKVNLRAAGFHQHVEVAQSDFRDYEPTVLPNFVMTNPPHGHRLGEEEQLIPLYRALGDFLKHKTGRPAKGFVFTGSLELSKQIGLASKRRYVLNNGGIECRLLEFDLY